ncbi:MAG: DNA-directed RNA polymerase subunit omega [Candidatus Goldiibacteriota bacterium]
MKKVDFSIEDFKEKMPNKYAATLVVASRAKAIKENPGDIEDDERKLKPTTAAVKEFKEDRLKFDKFDVTKINLED